MIMKKGPQILCPDTHSDGVNVLIVDGVHSFDSGGKNNHRGVNELAAACRDDGAWR
jgi:hypothetical protein